MNRVRFDRALSLRLLFRAGLIAAVACWLAGLITTALIGVTFYVVFAAVMWASIMDDSTTPVCPHCRRRARLEADTCGRCGKLLRRPT